MGTFLVYFNICVTVESDLPEDEVADHVEIPGVEVKTTSDAVAVMNEEIDYVETLPCED